MTDTTTAETSTASADWNSIVHSGPSTNVAASASAAPPAPSSTLPDLPLVVGRLPIKCDTGKAIIRLPEAVKGVSCAAVFPNTSVLSDCYKAAGDVCRPAPKFARPLNDREIEVIFWGDGDGVVSGPGWKETGYPGGQLETRPIDFGVPFVEVLLVAGRAITCGCDSEKWASNEWGQA